MVYTYGMNTDAADSLINPYYAVTISDYLFKQKSVAAEEDWLVLNTALMRDIGARQWLEELLDVLTLPADKYDGHDIINPSTAVNLSESLHGEHKPIVTRQEWVRANDKLVAELGVNQWLERLLETLKTSSP